MAAKRANTHMVRDRPRELYEPLAADHADVV